MRASITVVPREVTAPRDVPQHRCARCNRVILVGRIGVDACFTVGCKSCRALNLVSDADSTLSSPFSNMTG